MAIKNSLAVDQVPNLTPDVIKTTRPPFAGLPSAAYVDPRISIEEIGRCGEALYLPLRSDMEASHYGKFLSIDVETGEYAIGATARDAYNQLLSKRPGAMLYTLRIGHRTAGRI